MHLQVLPRLRMRSKAILYRHRSHSRVGYCQLHQINGDPSALRPVDFRWTEIGTGKARGAFGRSVGRGTVGKKLRHQTPPSNPRATSVGERERSLRDGGVQLLLWICCQPLSLLFNSYLRSSVLLLNMNG